MIARTTSITRGDLECLELMMETTDLLSHHMQYLLPDQQGPHGMQAKHLGENACHSMRMPLFCLGCGGGASVAGTTHLLKSPHILGNQKHQ